MPIPATGLSTMIWKTLLMYGANKGYYYLRNYLLNNKKSGSDTVTRYLKKTLPRFKYYARRGYFPRNKTLTNLPCFFKLNCTFKAWHWGDVTSEQTTETPLMFYIQGSEEVSPSYTNFIDMDALFSRAQQQDPKYGNLVQCFDTWKWKGISVRITTIRRCITRPPEGYSAVLAYYDGTTQQQTISLYGPNGPDYNMISNKDNSIFFTDVTTEGRPYSKYYRIKGWNYNTMYAPITTVPMGTFALRSNTVETPQNGAMFEVKFTIYIEFSGKKV